MSDTEIIQWLLSGDVCIQYQVYRDLLGEERPDLRDRIEYEGYGAIYLSRRNANGDWGKRFYEPKWTSTHYTLLDLRNLCISPNQSLIRETLSTIVKNEKSEDGGINPYQSSSQSDVCVNGMFLNYACYFNTDAQSLKSVVDFLLSQQMRDGGFNCRSNRSPATHSSLHSTLSVAEGILSYRSNGYTYRLEDLKTAEAQSKGFILLHQFYRSDHTGEIISDKFLNFPYPPRWQYDIVKALDYFRACGDRCDERMLPALAELSKKRRKDRCWSGQVKHPGATHLQMEEPREASRWNTLRALRILRHFT